MRFAETFRYLLLEISGVPPCLHQTFQEGLVGSLICRISFVHKSSLRDRPAIPQNREWRAGTDMRPWRARNLRGTEEFMSHCFLNFPETAGRIVEHIRYIYDPSGAPEVDIRFTDGVSLSIKLRVGMTTESELYRTCEGDVEVLRRYPETSGNYALSR